MKLKELQKKIHRVEHLRQRMAGINDMIEVLKVDPNRSLPVEIMTYECRMTAEEAMGLLQREFSGEFRERVALMVELNLEDDDE